MERKFIPYNRSRIGNKRDKLVCNITLSIDDRSLILVISGRLRDFNKYLEKLIYNVLWVIQSSL